jgi:hypothetical protein
MIPCDEFVASARLSRFLPHYGGGLWRGVAAAGLPMPVPLPPRLRVVNLPLTGGDDKREG